MNGRQRAKVWGSGVAAVVAIVVAIWASSTIGGDSNNCKNQSVCGQGNTTNYGGSNSPTVKEESK